MITKKINLVDQKYLVDQGWPKPEGASDCWSKKFVQWFVVIYDQRARYHLPNLTPFNMRRALQNIANSSHKLLPYFYRHLPVLALKLNPPFAPIDCIIIHLTFAPFKENKSKLFLVQRIWQCSIDFWIPSIWFFLPECFSPRFTIGIRCMFFLLEIQWSKIWPISLFRIFTQRDWKKEQYHNMNMTNVNKMQH